MYHRYFGLQEAPFSIAVNPRYMFMSARHRDALAHLLYGVGVGGGFILLTGEVGTGKTTVNRCLLEQLPDNTDIALVLNPALNAMELLATVCDELGIAHINDEPSLKNLTDKLHQFLLANHAKSRNTVLLIDEAQHLKFEVLEQIRLLTNLETNTKKLLQIILVGQPELRTLLTRPELRQLAQRITARYQLKPLSLAETHAYIRHRLQVAGLPAGQELFPRPIVKGIHHISRGVPRLINVLCDRMLLGTYGQNKTVVDRAMLKQAIREVMGEDDEIPANPISRNTVIAMTLGAVAVIGLLVGLVAWQLPGGQPEPAVDFATELEQSAIIARPQIVDNQDALATAVSIATPATEEIIEPIPAAAIESVDTPAQPWINSQQQALHELAKALGFKTSADIAFCSAPDTTVRCEQLTVKTWQALLSFNRPAVLTLITPSKMQVYATLLTIEDDRALLHHDGRNSDISLQELGELWTGEFIFLWQPAQYFQRPVARGDSGPMVHWLAQKFAKIDGQQTPLADQVFTPALAQRVMLFQQDEQLEADGVVGLKTLLKINEQLGIAHTLDNNPTLTVHNEKNLAAPTSKSTSETSKKILASPGDNQQTTNVEEG